MDWLPAGWLQPTIQPLFVCPVNPALRAVRKDHAPSAHQRLTAHLV